MEYGLIAEKVGHSFSWEIHSMLGDYDYAPTSINEERLVDFFKAREFRGINVTIPYKERVIPLIDELDGSAKEIGAVNTVVNRDGKLFGYNTDFYGMKMLISHIGINIEGKKVAILGTGGTSKTALAVLKSLGAREIIRVSREGGRGDTTYALLHSHHPDTEVIINTTPVGMYPNIFDTPLSLDGLDRLVGVVDVVYNPIRTPLILSAKKRGIACEGGLYMLVAQAVRASELFLDKTYPVGTVDEIFNTILKEKENIVLIGMPSSGKSTVGKILAEKLDRVLVDTDEIFTESISDIRGFFEKYGEISFRDEETRIIKNISSCLGAVISTGGGAVLREENIRALRENGRIYFIDRPLEKLTPTSDRPTASDSDAIARLYKNRIDIYKGACDVRVDASGDPCEICKSIREDFGL